MDCENCRHLTVVGHHDTGPWLLMRPMTDCIACTARLSGEGCRCCLLVASLTSLQHPCISQGQICSDNCTCCHTEIEVDQTLYLTQPRYTDTGPASPSPDPITPGTWQGSNWSTNFSVSGMTRPRKVPTAKAGIKLGSTAVEMDTLTTRPTRRYAEEWCKPHVTSDAYNMLYSSLQINALLTNYQLRATCPSILLSAGQERTHCISWRVVVLNNVTTVVCESIQCCC